jgi:YHS domain-containing protein
MKKMSTFVSAGLALILLVVPALNAVAADGKAPIAGGYCAVAYAKMGKAVKGSPQFASVVDGQAYHFVSAEAKKMFDAEPTKYPIAYQGYCATGVAMGKKLVSNPEIFTVHKGTTYLFSNAEAKMMFDKDPEMTISKAAANWPKIK